MSALELVMGQPWMARLGWTLVHFLWQGTVIAVVYAAVRGMGGRLLSARACYALACAALAAMAAAPPITFLVAGDVAAGAAVRASWPLADGAAWERLLRWLVVAWAAGVALFSARLIGGWRLAARMRRVAVAPAPAEWREALDALMARMRVAAPVRLLASSLATAPAVVGWLRPVILVPVEALTGVPVGQMRALLAHELAHILRHDYLVNILQSVAEAALFYHPAVWWVSEQIRTEMEACCDDLAVQVTGDLLAYASALADLDSRRRAALRLVTAADGGSLMSRIRRLLGQAEPLSHTLPGPGAVGALTVLWLAGIGAVVAHGAHSPASMQLPTTTSARTEVAAPARLAAALLLDPFFALPLQQARVSDAEQQSGTISGVVTTTSGAPISRAMILCSTTGDTLNATSDEAGKFAFEKLPPGTYGLHVSHLFYLNTESGDRLLPVTVAAGQRVADITIKLTEPATVYGRTVDEDGDPVANAKVIVAEYSYDEGRRRLSAVASTSSGDNGEFKITRIPPGRYVVRAQDQPSWASSERAPIPAVRPGRKFYNPTSAYYGGSSTLTTAAWIDITAGQSFPLGEIKMTNQPLLHVRGKVTGDLGMVADARVVWLSADGGSTPWSYGADIRTDGSFDLVNVHQIDEIAVGVYSRNQRLLAWTRTPVGQGDVDGVVLTVVAAPMSGLLHTEGPETATGTRKTPMRILLICSDAPTFIAKTGTVNADGTFTIPLVAAGLYTAEVSGLPEGSYLKSARLNGKESLDEGIEWIGPSSGLLELTVSPKAAVLEGTLVDNEGKPVAGTVTLVPVPDRRCHGRLYPTATADAHGKFRFSSLTPGKYKVYGWEEIESTAHWNPDFLRPFVGRGESIEVGESGHATATPKRISVSVMRDALRKAGM